MKNQTNINGVVLDERIAYTLQKLQDGGASAIASGLDKVIGYLLEEAADCDNPKDTVNMLFTLHYARTELLALVPNEEGGKA